MYPPYNTDYVAGKCFWYFVPLYWLTNNNENKNEKQTSMTEKEKEYRRERMVRSLTKCNLLTMGCKTTGQVAREGVQEGADGALTDEV